jgi:hypothetical protein
MTPSAGVIGARAENQKAEGLAIGACSVLRNRAAWRLVSRDPDALSALICAMMASSVHASQLTAAAVTELFLLLTVRYIRPAAVARALVRSLAD